ncbi:hypothetical protein CFOL_v3_29655 [Cephalotus follicularis]|uniref:Uncharacterized protein n=1 Tax=Cephalotus follicularis TaxID=3775 RepID=A0A1Q3D1A7_CEPFO|nr:hypothetical protein CFOL_v3_29655 [Cephalotus follicularis]
MGTHFPCPLKPATSFTHFHSLPHKKPINIFPNNNNNTISSMRCSSTRPRGPRWDSNAENDDYYKATKQRNWFSTDDDDDWGFDLEDDFWVFKQVFRSLGWMLPAIAISLLLGTGPNAFIMALAVPLGQSALSLAIDKVWGRTSSSSKSRPRTKTKKKPFARAASNVTTEGWQEENMNGKGGQSYQSWDTVVGDSYMKGDRRVPRYGGWDEIVGTQKVPRRATSKKANGLAKHQMKGKFSSIGRVKDTPLLLRLLIAAFPFLGSWTKLLL